MASDAGGLLLTMRKDSTVFVLSLLSLVLKPLARLSKALQCGTGNVVCAMQLAKAVLTELTDTAADLSGVKELCHEMIKKAEEHKVYIKTDMETTLVQIQSLSQKYLNVIIAEMQRRFSDDVGKIAEIQDVLRNKPEKPDFGDVCRIVKVPQDEIQCEWRILRRMSSDLATTENLLELACKPEKAILFPAFSHLARKILLLPIGTAGVERSFSAMNRILNSDRCRLLPEHVDSLMKLTMEGPDVPDVRNATPENDALLLKLIDSAYKHWLTKPRRY